MGGASLLLRGARLLPFESGVHGDAVLVRNGRIEAVGPGEELRQRASDAREVDLRGCVLLPGLTDTHTHFFEWARRLAGIDLSHVRDLDELEAVLRAAARSVGPEPRWIGGSGWDPRRYGRPDRVHRGLLDAIFPDRPVVLEARDFHTLWCNSRALEEAGVLGADAAELTVPSGGRLGRYEDGSPDGLLYETAWDLVWRARPPESEGVAERWIDAAVRQAHAYGLTGVHCMEPMSTLAHYRRLAEREALGLRLCFHTPLADLDARIERGEASYEGADPWLRIGGVKVFMDGSLGSRSACMHGPYPDGNRGVLLLEEVELDDILRRAGEAGIAGTVHAIGDRTVEIVTSALARARQRDSERGRILLHRVEHAQCVPPGAARLLARVGIYCAMQPVHLIDDAPLLDSEWGDASRWAYPLRSLVDLGVRVGLGSDAPVATPDPRAGIVAAMVRRGGARADGPEHRPSESLSALEALRGYTVDAALGSGREDELGRLRPGALADLTALDDVLDADPRAWLDATVRLTVVGGNVVYEDL